MDFHHYMQRAKVYRLNDEGNWDDKGTGHVTIEFLERSEAVGLVVIDEEDNATLLVHRISADDIYRRTEDHIISWTDPEVATDLALSFQDRICCSYIWDQICNVRRTIHYPAVGTLDVGPRSANEVLEHLGTSQSNDGVGNEVLELPAVELSSLPQILKVLTDASLTFSEREQIAALIVKDPSFLRKLAELFAICEDLENLEGLHMLFKIAKTIISLNYGRLFEIIFSEKFIMDFVGMLEYDPDVASRQNHRAFLKEQVTFKEAVPIEDPAILAKIHQTYRIGYIKDVILPNVLDNPTFLSINAMIAANNVSVVSALLEQGSFLKSLFTELKSPSVSETAKRDLVHFLQELCSLSKSLQPSPRVPLFSALIREGLFEVVTDVLGSADENLRLSGTDILIVVLNHDPSMLRRFLIQQQGNTLFSYLVTGMLTPSQGGVQAQLLEVMRMLLDCEITERQPPEKSPFLDVFYGKYMDQIMDVLASGTSFKGSSNNKKSGAQRGRVERPNSVSPEILGTICELLCFCVQHHAIRIQYYIQRNQLIEKVLRLVTRREKYLVVAAVRFLRTCVGRKDEFYYRYIIKHDLFEPVVQAFLANGNRYNLLNSAVLELFNFILKENIKSLIAHVVEKYHDKLENIQYVDTFSKLKLKYDQASEGMLNREQDSGAVRSRDKGSYSRDRLDGFPDSRRRKDERALDKDEEEYFNEDSDDEEDTASVQAVVPAGKPAQAVIVNGGPLSGAFGLVDYEDEDEDPPATVRNNGTEHQLEIPAGSPGIKDSVWYDIQEDKMIQNAKRKSLSGSTTTENDSDVLKRRKASIEGVCPSESEERVEHLRERNKVEASLPEGGQSCLAVSEEKTCDNSLGKDSKSSGRAPPNTSSAESAGTDADSLNSGSDKLGSVTNGAGILEVHGVAGS